MGIISSLLFGPKKNDEDRLRRAAGGQSVVGNVLGTSSYMKEWNRQKREILDQYEIKERSLRKEWAREDQTINREFSKDKARYDRKMNPDKAARFYAAHKRDEQRSIQRDRDRTLLEMEQEKNEAIRNIQKNIKQWK